VSQSRIGLAIHDDDVLTHRAWLAVDCILDHTAQTLCERTGLAAS
jgi:hypothetical protein